MMLCRRCNQDKPEEDFYADRGRQYGVKVQHICISCRAEEKLEIESRLPQENSTTRWTKEQTEVVTRDISIEEMALLTGRSYQAVLIKRHRVLGKEKRH